MVDLTPEQIRELNERFESLHDAAIAALQSGLYASDFQATRARLIPKRDAPPGATGADAFHLDYPRGDRETLFWRLVWLAHSHDVTPAPVRERPPLPNETQINSFTYGSLQQAVKAFARGDTAGDVHRRAKLPRQDAARVRVLFKTLGLLRLNATGKLDVDDRVARKGTRYVLRYLDESDSSWLDPYDLVRTRKG